jgi:ubiquinone/menaquinone biosynthesis C-methylase UbiE
MNRMIPPDLILFLQVAHHMKDFDLRIRELAQKIRPQGFMLIREHDVRNFGQRLTVIFEHFCYSLQESKEVYACREAFTRWFYSYHFDNKEPYMSQEELKDKMQEVGFRAKFMTPTSKSSRTFNMIFGR